MEVNYVSRVLSSRVAHSFICNVIEEGQNLIPCKIGNPLSLKTSMPIFVTILKPGCLLTCMKYYTSLTFMPPQAMRSGGCLFRRPDVLYFGLVRRVGQAKPLWSHVFFSWLSYYFCRVMRCISAAYAVTRCLSVCPCVKVKVKVKEVDLYSAFIVVPHTLGAQVRITQCYLQVTPYLPLPRKHSPEWVSV